MFALDLFNTDHERRLAEGAVDQLEQRRIDDLAMKMDDLVARAKTATTPEVKAALVKEFQKCRAERDSYFKIKDECMGYGGLGEAGIGQDIVNRTEKMARATPSTPTGKVASTVKNAAKWLAGRGGPGKEGPTYEGAEDIEDRGEYDQEGDMVKDNLHTIRREADRLEQILSNNENVPEWVQDKLAQVKGMMTSSSEYMQTQRERGHEEATGKEGFAMAENQKKNSEEVEEGYQDFNKVEPYEVCLAGKPVKQFDYYEDARRFHDNWKKKLYRAGDKTKADKITLNPVMDKEVKEGIADTKQLFHDYSELYYSSHEGYATNGQDPEEYHADIESQMDTIEREIWKQYGNAGVKKLKKYAHEQFWGKDSKQGVAEGATVAYTVLVVDPETYEKKKLNISALTKEHAKEEAEAKGYKVLRVDSEQGVAEAGSPAQQAAIAIAMKRAGKKPKSVDETTAFLARAPRLSYGDQAQHTTLGLVQVERHMPDGSVVVYCERDGKRYRTQPSALKMSVAEVAPPGAKAERMVKHIKKSLSKDGKLSDKDKAIAYATTWKAHNAGKVEEAETDYSKRRQRERDVDAGKPVAKQRPSKMTDYQKRRAEQKRQEALGEEQETSGVEQAILHRIMVAHTDLLRQFGPEKVMQAAEEVADNVGDVDEIGTSDVSAWVNQVRQILGAE